MNRTTRRSLFRGAAILAIATPAAAAGHPDAELIAACTEFDGLEQAYIDSLNGGPEEGPAFEAAEDLRDRIVEAQQPLVSADG